jgi:hypothetical protein
MTSHRVKSTVPFEAACSRIKYRRPLPARSTGKRWASPRECVLFFPERIENRMSDEPAAALPDGAPQVICEFTDYATLEAGLRLAKEKRNLSFAAVDQIAGLSDGHASKMLAPNGERGITVQSLGFLLGALGVKGVLIEDAEAQRRVENYMAAHKLGTRDDKRAHSGAVSVTLSKRFLKKIGAIGGKNSRSNMSRARARQLARKAVAARNAALSPEQRSASARKAALSRWAACRSRVPSHSNS